MEENQLQYPYLIIDNFLSANLQKIVLNDFDNLDGENFLDHPLQYKFAACQNIEILRHFYSRDFKSRLESFFNRELIRSKRYPFPQYYAFPKGAKGLPPHTDAGEGRDLAVILYLSHWSKENAGELLLMSSPDKVCKIIEPIFNRLVCLELSSKTWHAVNPTLGDWKRVSLIVDWDYKK